MASVRWGASRACACSGCATRQWGDGSMSDAEVGHSSYSSARLATSWAPRRGYDDQGELAMGIVRRGTSYRVGRAHRMVGCATWGKRAPPYARYRGPQSSCEERGDVGRGAWRCRRYIASGLGLPDTAARLLGGRRGVWERGAREMSCGCSSVHRGGESRVLQLAKTWGQTSFFLATWACV